MVKSGTYVPISISNSEIIIEASKEDLSPVILLEAELLFNNCIEHLLELNRLAIDILPRSDAWNVVTFYYFGYFAAHAFLRMLGTPVLYLRKELTNNISATLGTSQSIGGGTFWLEKVRDISISSSEYRLKKLKDRLHEATWLKSIHLIESVLKHTKTSAKPQESLFFNNLVNKSLFKVYDAYGWPSSIRNKANYRPGFAYRLIENKTIAGVKKIIGDIHEDGVDLGDKIRASIKQCIPSSEEKYFSTHINMLFYTILGFYCVAKELYLQLNDRRNIDKRMHLKRDAFIKKTNPSLKGSPWSEIV